MYLIGEKLNGFVPKTRKAIEARDAEAIRNIAREQEAAGANALDICTAVNGDEMPVFEFLISNVQEVSGLPISVDSPDPHVCLAAARLCARPGIINSVSPEGDKLDVVFGALAESGWSFVAMLTDSRGGVPETVAERLAALDTILEKAREYGVTEDRLFIDPMVMTLGARPDAFNVFAECVRAIRKDHPEIHIVSGTSNISHGLPRRKQMNAAFLNLAEQDGMDAGICDPACYGLETDPLAAETLRTGDTAKYIAAFRDNGTPVATETKTTTEALCAAVTAGEPERAEALAKTALEQGVTAGELIAAMTDAMTALGERFSAGEVFIPELVMAAKAMKKAGELLKSGNVKAVDSLGTVIIGTVMGDMHDIGKNIVAMLLESAGFNIVDLGVDVLPEDFIDEALAHEDTKIIALSCLLTTTMPAMQETVEMIKEEPRLSGVLVMVGGAPVTPQFAEQIGADIYTEDAVECARTAKERCNA
ncbi:MAG: cobalamin-dependent protein [Clostridia bacterium]|nr:cobalamin-dependent protein [Clostridia bacterium]